VRALPALNLHGLQAGGERMSETSGRAWLRLRRPVRPGASPVSLTWIKATPWPFAEHGGRSGGLAMNSADVGMGDAWQELAAEESRVIAWLVDGTDDFECLGAEAAAEFGW
jgi:hypothetical protein